MTMGLQRCCTRVEGPGTCSPPVGPANDAVGPHAPRDVERHHLRGCAARAGGSRVRIPCTRDPGADRSGGAAATAGRAIDTAVVVSKRCSGSVVFGSHRIASVARDLQRRGFDIAYDGGTGLLLTRPPRVADRDDDVRGEFAQDASPNARVPKAVLQALKERAAIQGSRAWMRPFTIPGADGGMRIALDTTTVGGKRVLLGVSEPLDEVDELLGQIRGAVLIAVPVLATLALLLGYGLAGRALAPVTAMSAEAKGIGARTMHERLTVQNPHDEMGQLAGEFNAVLDRLDAALEQQHHFTADASHELRTPVAIIRTEAEVALGGHARSTAEYRDALRVILDGSEQLSRIVNDMFLLARTDAGQATITRNPLYLDELAADTMRSMTSLAAARGVSLALVAPGEVLYHGDEALLRRVLANLLDNALKHAPHGTTVTVTLDESHDGCRLAVSDVGGGIPESARPYVFDRFFRADEARARVGGAPGSGAGLGLAIAREIVELHGGHLSVREPAAQGTTFDLFLSRDPYV